MTRDKLTEHGEKLLAVIRRAGGKTVTRSYIADGMGKTRLNVWETKLLDEMATAGLIEAEKRPIKGPIAYEWVYRATQKE
jgi:hypothetical protein